MDPVTPLFRSARRTIDLFPDGPCRDFFEDELKMAVRATLWAQTHTYDDVESEVSFNKTVKTYLLTKRGRFSLQQAVLDLCPPLRTINGDFLLSSPHDTNIETCCITCFVKNHEAVINSFNCIK